MICPACNLLIPEDSRYCKECGNKLESTADDQEALSNQERRNFTVRPAPFIIRATLTRPSRSGMKPSSWYRSIR